MKEIQELSRTPVSVSKAHTMPPADPPNVAPWAFAIAVRSRMRRYSWDGGLT